MPGCTLGCAAEYRVLVADRCGQRTFCDLTPSVQELTWTRTLDDTSTARITVTGTDCCGCLSDIDPWARTILILRDGEPVWGPGPAITVPYSGPDPIVAWDASGWLQRRVIHRPLCYDPDCGGTPTPAVAVAADLVRDGFAPDDPCVLEHLITIPGGPPVEQHYTPCSTYTLDALRELGRTGLDWTAVGQRIILMPPGHSLGRTATLTDDHLLGVPSVVADGTAAATDVCVHGAEDVACSVGAPDPYYGVIERLIDDDAILTEDTACAVAATELRAGNPPPLVVSTPPGTALSPRAPVCINDLVPGVIVPLSVATSCRPAVGDLRLITLDVTWNAENGETVKITLATAGVDAADLNAGSIG